MTVGPQGDDYTLGLLVDLRDVYRKIGDNHYRMASSQLGYPPPIQ
jgi:hypothetical protein